MIRASKTILKHNLLLIWGYVCITKQGYFSQVAKVLVRLKLTLGICGNISDAICDKQLLQFIADNKKPHLLNMPPEHCIHVTNVCHKVSGNLESVLKQCDQLLLLNGMMKMPFTYLFFKCHPLSKTDYSL